METVVKSIRIQKSLASDIQEMADKENRNFSNMVETLLLEQINGIVVTVHDITELNSKLDNGCSKR